MQISWPKPIPTLLRVRVEVRGKGIGLELGSRARIEAGLSLRRTGVEGWLGEVEGGTHPQNLRRHTTAGAAGAQRTGGAGYAGARRAASSLGAHA